MMVVEAVKKDVEANSLVHIMRFVCSPCPCKSMYLAHNNKFDFDANNKIISNINPSSADMSDFFLFGCLFRYEEGVFARTEIGFFDEEKCTSAKIK